jgi:hypothetical protein
MKRILTLFAGGFFVIALALGAAAAPEVEDRSSRKTDLSDLPKPVSAMRQRILEAARSGDIFALRSPLRSNESTPNFSFGDATDPFAYWREASGDKEGREILAVMVEILNMPYAIRGAGTDYEMYVWPYLYESDMAKLTPREEVDLYQLVTPAEAKKMREFGAYTGYRLGIGPDGTWHYFVAGD